MNWLESIYERLARKAFIKNVILLAGGTAFAQGITIIILPILTRIYSPEDFGILAIYISVISIISTAACLRLDIAIPLAETEEESAQLTIISIFVAFFVSLFCMIIILIWPDFIIKILGNGKFKEYLILIPIGIFFTSSYSALQFWMTKNHKFKEISITRLTQSISGSVVQIGLGLVAALNAWGLLIGQIVINSAGLFSFFKRFFKNEKSVFKTLTYYNTKKILKKYERFPKYSTLEAFANSAAIQAPLIIIVSYVSVAEVGYIMIAMKVMQIPMKLIGNAIGQVFLSSAASVYKKGELSNFTIKITSNLFKIGAGPIVFAGIIAPSVFTYVLGEQWVRAGEIIIWMVPWFVVQFLVSPVAMVFHVTNHQISALIIQIFGLIFRCGSILVVGILGINIFTEVYAITGFIFYLIYLVWALSLAKVSILKMLYHFLPGIKYLLGWLVLGLILQRCMNF